MNAINILFPPPLAAYVALTTAAVTMRARRGAILEQKVEAVDRVQDILTAVDRPLNVLQLPLPAVARWQRTPQWPPMWTNRHDRVSAEEFAGGEISWHGKSHDDGEGVRAFVVASQRIVKSSRALTVDSIKGQRPQRAMAATPKRKSRKESSPTGGNLAATVFVFSLAKPALARLSGRRSGGEYGVSQLNTTACKITVAR